mmetsp:Transcript_7231/g.16553  ORF Transcript_7231/g.16553 Transcript_7231/m.16553 type:complete len:235 (-) Transcript_7231:896-1600(-)
MACILDPSEASSILIFSSRLAILSISDMRCSFSATKRAMVACDDSSCRSLKLASSLICLASAWSGMDCSELRPWEMCSSRATMRPSVACFSPSNSPLVSSYLSMKSVISRSRAYSFSYLSFSLFPPLFRSARSAVSSAMVCSAFLSSSFTAPTRSSIACACALSERTLASMRACISSGGNLVISSSSSRLCICLVSLSRACSWARYCLLWVLASCCACSMAAWSLMASTCASCC